MLADDLGRLQPFADVDGTQRQTIAAALVERSLSANEVVLRQADTGDSFVIVLDGELRVTRTGRHGEHPLATVGPGSILGELSLLTGRPRLATVTALGPARVAIGDADAFHSLVAVGPVHDHLVGVVAHRLAEAARAVRMALDDGEVVGVRPLLPQDHDEYVTIVERMPPEWLRYRFFSAARPSRRLLDYLVDIDYVDHFAWLVTAGPDHHGIAVARYIRSADDSTTASFALGVVGEYQNRGLATRLIGALGAAASNAGIAHLTGEVLYDNHPMRAVLRKVGASWKHLEPGVTAARLEVSATQPLLDPSVSAELAATAHDIVTAAGLALTCPTRDDHAE